MTPTRFHLSLSLLLIAFAWSSALAGPGDTTVVQTFTFNQRGDVKDGRFLFPPASSHWQRILMYYTLKCNPDQNPKCGEWDYLTYTNLYQHTGRFDSTRKLQPSFTVNRAVRDTLDYITTPGWLYTARCELTPVYGDPSTLTTVHTGSGSVQNSLPFPAGGPDARTVMLWRASELSAAGMKPGAIVGMRFHLASGSGTLTNLRIRIRPETATSIDAVVPEHQGFITVLQKSSVTVTEEWTTLRFTSPYSWDGSSNLLVDVSLAANSSADIQVRADDAGFPACMASSDPDAVLTFAGKDLVRLPAAAFAGIDTAVSVSFWAFGDASLPVSTSAFEAASATGKRVINAHLPWSDAHVYWDAGNDAGYDRVERLTDSGSQYKNQWNHWAFVKTTGAGQMKVYLNGEIWHGGNGMIRPLGRIASFSIGGSATSTNFYRGSIDDFAVYNVELTQPTIRAWKNRHLDATHPNHANLMAAYSFNEAQGGQAFDQNGGNPGTLVGQPRWGSYRGDRVKDFTTTPLRPEVMFEQGTFTSVFDTTWVVDSTAQPPLMVIRYDDTLHASVPTDTIYVWAPYQRHLFDSRGRIVDSVTVGPTGTMIRVDHPYYDPPFEIVNRYELGRFITPYGINLDLGEGWTWVYDVTDFRPLLADSVHISAGNWQELLDLKFVFIEGTPDREVVKIENLWQGNFGLSVMEQRVQPRTITLDPAAKMVKLRTTVTGHGMGATNNCAEFCPNTHSVLVDGVKKWSWEILQECAMNPLYPQGGTWIYDRAGWCPGMPCTTREFDITPLLTGNTVTLDYNTTYDPDGNYVFESQLVSYGEPTHQLDAAIEEVIQPSNFKLNTRFNPACGRPRVVIMNHGAQTLTSATINYGIMGGATGSMEWTGSLKFLESAEVVLPALGAPAMLNRGVFTATISNPNGGMDEDASNNTHRETFDVVPVHTSDIAVWLKTNARGGESLMQVFDDTGRPVYTRGNFNNNLIYKDTLRLPPGCYEFVLTDAGDNGLSFFANNDGTGSCTVRLPSGSVLKTLNPDFGRETRYQFIRATPTGVERLTPETPTLEMFPNPAGEALSIRFTLETRASVRFELHTTLGGRVADIAAAEFGPGTHQQQLTLGGLVPGSYILTMVQNGVAVRSAQVNIVR